MDKKKRNKLRNLRARVAIQEFALLRKKDRLLNCPICATRKVRKRIANLKFEPPKATCRKKKLRKKLRRRVEERNELVCQYQAKATGRVA